MTLCRTFVPPKGRGCIPDASSVNITYHRPPCPLVPESLKSRATDIPAMRRRDRCRNAAAREDAFFRRATREPRGKRAKWRETKRVGDEEKRGRYASDKRIAVREAREREEDEELEDEEDVEEEEEEEERQKREPRVRTEEASP